MADVRIAVIGAGIAGLACARELAGADARVTVFERSRGLGGRLGTRRQGNLAFDHGAQFITARSRPFLKYVEIAKRAGMARAWQPRLMEDDRRFDAPFDEWHVGMPGMSAIVRPLSRGIELQTGVGVHELLQGVRGWELQTVSGRQARIFDADGSKGLGLLRIAFWLEHAGNGLRGHGHLRHLAGRDQRLELTVGDFFFLEPFVSVP